MSISFPNTHTHTHTHTQVNTIEMCRFQKEAVSGQFSVTSIKFLSLKTSVTRTS